MSDIRDRIARGISQTDEATARREGLRAPGDEHRVWVDHDALEALLGDAAEFEKLWTYCGLGELAPRDPVPAPLRALLRAHRSTDLRFLAPVSLLLGVGIATAGAGAIRTGVGLITLGVAAGYLLMLVGDDLLHRHGDRIPGSRRRRLARALARLRAAPFVATVRGKRVENLPVLSWLLGRDAALQRAHRESEDRLREIRTAYERRESHRARIGDVGADGVLVALAERGRAELSLQQRFARLRAEIAARSLEVRARIDAPPDAGRPTALPETPTGDLGARLDRLRADIREERRQFDRLFGADSVI